jgi:hypothetical protein
MGSNWLTVVSRSAGPAMRLPSLLSARLVTPEIGASTRVYPRLRLASTRRAFADFTSAAATSSAEMASS